MNFVRSADEIDCPKVAEHTAAPTGYLAWHDWAAKKGKTHKQIRCAGCGLFAIWIPKKSHSYQR